MENEKWQMDNGKCCFHSGQDAAIQRKTVQLLIRRSRLIQHRGVTEHLSEGSYKGTLAKSNLGNADDKNALVTIVFSLIINNVGFQYVQQMKYTSREGNAK